MGLGGTTKKLQKVANMAEEMYGRLSDLREQLIELHESVEHTSAQVERLQREQAANRALLEQLAEQQGINVDEALESVSTEEPRAPPGQRPDQRRGPGSQNQGPRSRQDQGPRNQQPGQGQDQNQRRGQRQDQGQGQGPPSSVDTDSRSGDRPSG